MLNILLWYINWIELLIVLVYCDHSHIIFSNNWILCGWFSYSRFGVHCLCHYVASFLVTLDPETTSPMYSWRTCKNYYSLHNINENIIKRMEQPIRRRQKGLWWSSWNSTIKHNKRLVFQRQCMVCPLSVVVK
jgi:hypothetical protein